MHRDDPAGAQPEQPRLRLALRDMIKKNGMMNFTTTSETLTIRHESVSSAVEVNGLLRESPRTRSGRTR